MPRTGDTRPPGIPKGSIVQPGGPIDASRTPLRIKDLGRDAIALWEEVLGPEMWGRVAGRSDRYRIERYCELRIERDRLFDEWKAGEPNPLSQYGHLTTAQKGTQLNKWETLLGRIENEYTRRMAAVTLKDPKAGASKKTGADRNAADAPWTEGRVQ